MPLLQDRDHVFLIDNSRSMQEFENQVIDTFINLAHLLEKADGDGLDVVLTSRWEERKRDRRIDNLVSFVRNNFQKGANNRCFIETGLNAVISKVIEGLPSAAREAGKLSRVTSLIRRKHKPASIYILTDGVWDSAKVAKDGLCKADMPIRQLIGELRNRNLYRSLVSLQFIRFGNDPTGIKRLKSLDDKLGEEYPGFDIVDHKDSTGPVWPMLVGSLDDGVDLEDSMSEDDT